MVTLDCAAAVAAKSAAVADNRNLAFIEYLLDMLFAGQAKLRPTLAAGFQREVR
jgi:hypothetical protein